MNFRVTFSFAELEGRFVDGSLGYEDLGTSLPKNTISLLLSRKLKQNLVVSLGYYNVSNMDWPGGDDTGGVSYGRFHNSQVV